MILAIAALLGASGVVLGAFGAHALRERLGPALIEVWKTAVFYHLVHAVAALGVAAVADRLRWPAVTAALFAAGVALFSGSLYLLAVTGEHRLGAVTPFGGAALIAGWLTMLVGAAAARPRT